MKAASIEILIRKSSEKDADALMHAFHKSKEQLAPWIFPPQDIHEFATRENLVLVQLLDSDKILGYFNLSNIIRGSLQQAFLGFAAFHPHKGKGHMANGMKLVLKFAFEELNLHRVEANIQPENLRSIKLVERSGFQKEGFSKRYLKIGDEWRDHERWAITREDWLTSR